MKYVRLYATPDGESHFQDVDMALVQGDFAPPAPPVNVSTAWSSKRCLFTEAPAGWYGARHPTPARQWWIPLTGEVQMQTSDGEVRLFTPGSLVLLEDTTGKGHKSWVVGNARLTSAFIQLGEQ
jgi:hypothetical protein